MYYKIFKQKGLWFEECVSDEHFDTIPSAIDHIMGQLQPDDYLITEYADNKKKGSKKVRLTRDGHLVEFNLLGVPTLVHAQKRR